MQAIVEIVGWIVIVVGAVYALAFIITRIFDKVKLPLQTARMLYLFVAHRKEFQAWLKAKHPKEYEVALDIDLKSERYPMSKDQPAQVDCRVTTCIFHIRAKCTNPSPAITLNSDGTFVCWSEEAKE